MTLLDFSTATVVAAWARAAAVEVKVRAAAKAAGSMRVAAAMEGGGEGVPTVRLSVKSANVRRLCN